MSIPITNNEPEYIEKKPKILVPQVPQNHIGLNLYKNGYIIYIK